MSTPTTQPLDPAGPTSAVEVARFVEAVRAQLDDLSLDEVTELTGGLEADLTDALADESATPAERYGDPAEYARELRSAAGLPPRTGTGGPASGEKTLRRLLFGPFWPGRPDGVVARFDAVAVRSDRFLNQYTWWPPVRDFLVVLRPVWWLFRAYLAVQLLLAMAGAGPAVIRGGFAGFLLLLAAVVGSVELGRRSAPPRGWQQNLVLAGNALAVVVLLPVLTMAANSSVSPENSFGPSQAASGLSVNGNPVTNIFPYDAQGRPLTGVQLYDQDGQQLVTGQDDRMYDSGDGDGADDDAGDGTDERIGDMVPETGPGTPGRWNVFPLQIRIQDDAGNDGPVQPAPLPFTAVSPLVITPQAGAILAPGAAPVPGSTPVPGATPLPGPASLPGVTPAPGAHPVPGASLAPGATAAPGPTAAAGANPSAGPTSSSNVPLPGATTTPAATATAQVSPSTRKRHD